MADGQLDEAGETDETDEAATEPAPGSPGRHRAATGLVLAGFAATLVGLLLPFASNEAECLDHCADAHSYYAWNPLHNIGAPFLLIGIGAAIALWATPSARTSIGCWLAASLGFLGLLLQYEYAPGIIEELHLYGGPSLDIADTGWVLFLGWITLFTGALLASPSPDDDPAPPSPG